MSERATELAAQFERANRDFIEEVERLSDDQWQTLVPGENWTVGVVAHHVIACYGLIGGWIRDLANGEVARPTMEELDAINAEHARRHAGCSKAETLEQARRDGAETVGLVRGLTEAQLESNGLFNGRLWSTEEMVRRVLLTHSANHLVNIRSALA